MGFGRALRNGLGLACLIALALVLGTARAQGATINVPDDQGTIQLAVNNADAGDEIVVADGTYNENVNLDTMNTEGDITIRAANPGTTAIVNGGAGGPAFTATTFTGDITIEGFALDRDVTGAFDDGVLELTDVTGTVSIVNNTFQSGYGGAAVRILSTETTNPTTDIRILDNTATAGGDNESFLKLELLGSSKGDLIADGNTASGLQDDGFRIEVFGTSQLTARITDNTLSAWAASGEGIDVEIGENDPSCTGATVSMLVSGNSISDPNSDGMEFNVDGTNTKFTAVIADNTNISGAQAHGIKVDSQGALNNGTVNVLIDNNTVSSPTDNGIYVEGETDPGNTASTYNIVITNNSVSNATLDSIRIDADDSNDPNYTMNVDIRNNLSTNPGAGETDFEIAQGNGSTVNLEDGASSSSDPATVIQDNNPQPGTPTVNIIGTVNVQGDPVDDDLIPASIGDFVWDDTNGDGIQDGGELGLANVAVDLSGTQTVGGAVDRSTTTDGDGNYFFGALLPGSYTLTVTPPTGLSLSPQDQGGDDTLDSDFDPASQQVSVTLSTTDLTVDAGILQSVPEPEIDVQRPPGTSIADTGTDNVGTVSVGAKSYTYTVDNSAGSAELNVTNITWSGPSNVNGISITPTNLSVTDGTSETFDVDFTVVGNGVFSLDIDITNNDSDEGNYDIHITGTCDNVAPGITSFTRQTPATSPTNADTLVFRATFDEDVQNVDAGDFDVSGTTATVTGVTPNTASEYDLTVFGGDLAGLDGTVGLDLAAGQDITDSVGNNLPAGEPTTDETYTLDNTEPTVTAIDRADSDPTNASSVDFTVTFSESVSGIETGDFALAFTGTGGTISSVSASSGTTVTVTVDSITGDGTLGLNFDFDNSGSVVDAAGNAADADFTGQTYTIDNTAPLVTAIDRADSDPTNASSVDFTVTFSESVSGIETGDFVLATTGTSGTISSVSASSGTTVTVTVGSITGDGTLGLNFDFDNSGNVADAAGNTASADFTGQTYTVDNTGPNVTINRAGGQADPTDDTPINFTVVFNETVTGFATGDVTVGGTANPTTGTVTGSGTTYSVAVSGMTNDGTVTATIPAGVAQDALGNTNNASTSTDNSVTYEGLPDVNTVSVTGETSRSATANCTITDLGVSDPTAHGVVWNLAGGPDPTLADDSTDEGPVGGVTLPYAFTSTMTGLTPNTTYAVRAYATNDAGTAYGNVVGFTTKPAGVAPNTLLLLDEEESGRRGKP